MISGTVASVLILNLSGHILEDKKESIYEAQTLSALHISEKLGQYFLFLNQHLQSDSTRSFPYVLNVTNTKREDYSFLIKEGDHLFYYVNKLRVHLASDFLETFTQTSSANQIILLIKQQANPIYIKQAPEIELPASSFLKKIYSQNLKQGVIANYKKSNKGEYLNIIANIPSLDNCFLLLQIKQNDITELILKSLQASLTPLITLSLLILIIGVLLASRVIAPLNTLIKATKNIAQGDWDLNLPQKSNDELGTLTSAFNTMGQELKEAQHKILQSEKLASLGLFSAGIAHEVKNPMGAILGNAQLIKRKNVEKNEDINKYTETIIKESYRANRIVEDLLIFAKERELNQAIINTEDFLKEVTDSLELQIKENNILFKPTALTPNFYGDKDQLIQVMLNLILNSIDSLGGRDIREISFNISSIEEFTSLQLEDTGHGIEEEKLNKIFEPFFSDKKIGKGTGLGMAIVYGIIQKHNGSIEVQSIVDQGTKITILLPHK